MPSSYEGQAVVTVNYRANLPKLRVNHNLHSLDRGPGGVLILLGGISQSAMVSFSVADLQTYLSITSLVCATNGVWVHSLPM
jgi:hypothetical protein